MWQKKEDNSREAISIEEYLIKRKKKREESEADRMRSLRPENRQWMLAELYM
ncbi:MAG: hypothetical protein ACI4S2_00250 [Lachnospiraceae bacterium]